MDRMRRIAPQVLQRGSLASLTDKAQRSTPFLPSCSAVSHFDDVIFVGEAGLVPCQKTGKGSGFISGLRGFTYGKVGRNVKAKVVIR